MGSGARIEDRVAELERTVAAQRKVIAVLTERAEDRVARSGSAIDFLTQNVVLERVVGQKTRELARALEELRRTQAELTQAHKLTAIGQLASGVAHEINTPVQYVTDNTHFLERAFTTIMSLLALQSDALRDAELSDERRDELARAAKKARLEWHAREVPRALAQSLEGLCRVASIVGAMKTFAHVSHGETSPVNLREAIESTVTIARNEWKYVATLDLDLDPALDVVTCVRDELNQVVLNLVVNAAHAIAEVQRPEGVLGQIRVMTRAEGELAALSVSDTGCGIPPGIRDRIFEPFFTTKPVGKGTGQGLAMVYSIVQRHGGTIEVQSEVGRGTTFVVRLPRDGRPAAGEVTP